MIEHYVTAIVGIVLLSAIWIGVQSAWRNAFSDADADPDVLARRGNCGGCSGLRDCKTSVLERRGLDRGENR